jgi:hypothetical protein
MIVLKKVGSRIYLTGDTFAHKDRIKSVLGLTGKNFDGDRWWVGAAKRAAAEALVAELNAGPPVTAEKVKEDPGSVRLVGKAKYKGRTYYARYVGGSWGRDA